MDLCHSLPKISQNNLGGGGGGGGGGGERGYLVFSFNCLDITYFDLR